MRSHSIRANDLSRSLCVAAYSNLAAVLRVRRSTAAYSGKASSFTSDALGNRVLM